MIVGVPTEIKPDERRVGLTPSSANELTNHGHDVIVQSGAGLGIGAEDSDYETAGATIAADAAAVFGGAEMIVKVKEPQAVERAMLTSGHLLFTYLHLAPDAAQTQDLVASGATCIAYETVTAARGGLPLLAPMSKVAGRMSIQAGAHHLESTQGGAGLLLGGVPGVPPAKVVVIGGGVVGENAIEMAVGMGADVTVLDRSGDALDRLAKRFGTNLRTVHSNAATTWDFVTDADLVVGAVLIPGAKAPKIVTEEMVEGNAQRVGTRRCCHRPRRLHGDLEGNDPRCSYLPGPRCCALLRGQHARSGSPYLDLRAKQRDAAVRGCPRKQGCKSCPCSRRTPP